MSTQKAVGPAGHPYKIGEIIAKSGLSRQAIHFYIREGLLPGPVKTSRNLGWYSEQHLETLALIQKLQHERFMPLKAIKSLLQGSKDFTFSSTQLQILESIRSRLSHDHDELVVETAPAELAEEMGLSRREQKELRDYLYLAKNGVATVSDVEITRLWIRLRDAGLTAERGFGPKDLYFIYEIADILVDREIHLLRDRMDDLSSEKATTLIEIVVPTINSLFSIIHQRRLKCYVQSYLDSAQSARHDDNTE